MVSVLSDQDEEMNMRKLLKSVWYNLELWRVFIEAGEDSEGEAEITESESDSEIDISEEEFAMEDDECSGNE